MYLHKFDKKTNQMFQVNYLRLQVTEIVLNLPVLKFQIFVLILESVLFENSKKGIYAKSIVSLLNSEITACYKNKKYYSLLIEVLVSNLVA